MTLNQNQIKALELILDYIKESEHNDYLEFIEENKPENHIFHYAIELSKAFIKG